MVPVVSEILVQSPLLLSYLEFLAVNSLIYRISFPNTELVSIGSFIMPLSGIRRNAMPDMPDRRLIEGYSQVIIKSHDTASRGNLQNTCSQIGLRERSAYQNVVHTSWAT